MCCETCGSSDYKCGCEPVTIWVSDEALKQTISEHYVSKDDLRKLVVELKDVQDIYPGLHNVIAKIEKLIGDKDAVDTSE